MRSGNLSLNSAANDLFCFFLEAPLLAAPKAGLLADFLPAAVGFFCDYKMLCIGVNCNAMHADLHNTYWLLGFCLLRRRRSRGLIR